MDAKVRELCKQATIEKDSKKLSLLTQQAIELLDEQARMKGGNIAADERSSRNDH